MTARETGSARGSIVDLDRGKKAILILFLLLMMLLLACGLWPAIWSYDRLLEVLVPHAGSTGGRLVAILAAVIVFNYGYLIGLLALRALLPKHKTGFYPNRPGGRPPKEGALLLLNLVLAKLRFTTPWANIFSTALVAVPPLSFFYNRLFGPNPPIYGLGDTVRLFDPHLVKVGRHVQFGWGAKLSGHIFDQRGLLIGPIEIEDAALIGADCWLTPGVKVGHHAIVAYGAVVRPKTIIEPYEVWGGNPAKKIGQIEPEEPGS